MIIKYNHITKKRLILLVILMALILMPSIKSYAASTTNTTINKNNTYTNGSKYTAVCKDLAENSDLYCVEESQTKPWGNNQQQVVTYECIGSVDVDTRRKSNIVKKTGKCTAITNDECLKIAYALATKSKYYSTFKKMIEDNFDFNTYKGSYQFPDYHRAIAKNPWSAIIWDLHGASKLQGAEKYIEILSYFEPKGYGSIGALVGISAVIADVEENALTMEEINARTEIKEIQTTVKTYYNIEEENQNLANKIKELPNKSKPSEYIVIGPYKYEASKGDYISNIQVKKNGQNNYEEIHESIINPSKILVLSKQLNGEYKITYSDTEKRIGYDILPEFYVLVKKDSNIRSIDDLKVTIGRKNYEAKWYYFKGTNPSQALMTGNGKLHEDTKSLNYKVNLIPPVQVELDKVDTAGDAVEGAKFSIEYSNGLKGETKAVGKDGKIVFSQVQPTSPDEFTATITETFTPAGYKKLEKPIVLKFTYDQNKAVWKVEKISGPDEKITIGTVTKDSKSGINKIPVTVENKSIIEKLTLLKTSSVGGGKVEGAKFKLTLTNIASIKGYKIPTTGTPTIIVTTDKNGNIVLEDIEIADLSKDIVITVEETEAPVGYKKIEGKITVTLKRKGNTYTIHKAEKEDTVTDDEFKTGEVTLINHELVLNIKDIPIMNLGGIVWTEKIKTGKEQPDINNTYSESDDEALGGVTVRLLDENDKTVATTKTAEKDGQEVTYLNNLGKEGTVKLKQGQYLFTKLDDGTNYIPVGTDYKVEIDYDGITYNPLINPDTSMLYKNKEDNKGVFSKITSEEDHGLADGTKTIFGTENETQSKTNGGYTINYTLQDEENIPDKAIYSNVEKDGKQAFVTARSEKYLQKTDDWKTTWKDNNGVGEINLDSYAFDINFGLYKKFFDLNLGTDVDSAEIEINGQKTAYTYDQILDGMLDKDLKEKLYKTTDDKVDYNLYLAYSDYYYRIDDYKVPGDTNSLGQPYGEALPNKKDKNTELQVYVTYALQINNQSTQHNATGVKVKYSYDEGYEYVGDVEGTVNDEKNKILTISNINLVPGESKKITLKFKVRKNEDGTFFKKPSDTSKYTNVAEIVEYSTTEGRLVDADSAPGNTFLGENKPTTRREDDTDTANGIVITFKKNAERSISGKVFNTNGNNVSDVIVQLIELVEINNKQYEYIWQETVAGSNTVKTTDRNGYPGKSYSFKVDDMNKAGEYKFTQGIIPGNYIVRFIYGDGTYFDESIESKDATEESKNNIKTYNGEDYKSTYVDYNYNAEWYNNISLDGENSKAVDNEARRLKVMSYAVDVDGTKGAELALLSKSIGTDDEKLKAVLENTWMCAETLKIKVPVDTDVKDNTSDTTEVGNGSSPTISNTQFNNVNFGLMERPKTKLVLEKHITGLTVKPVASGVNLIANATADINKILDQGEGDQIQLEGQRDGLSATKSERTNRGLWYLQTDTTELAQGADAYITYTYVIRNEGDIDYLNKDLISYYKAVKAEEYAQKLSNLEGEVKDAKKQVAYTNGTYISDFYYTGTKGENDEEVLASVEQIQEALNPKVKFVNSTTDFNIIKNQDGSTLVENKNVYKEDGTGITEEEIKEQIESTKATGKMKKYDKDISKKLVVSVGLSASEIENGGVYDSYIAQVTHYTNAAGRRDQSTPANLSYVHSEDTRITLDKYNEEDEFWAETFRITKPTGEDKITPVQIAIITISAVAVLGVGIILIKKFVLKK